MCRTVLAALRPLALVALSFGSLAAWAEVRMDAAGNRLEGQFVNNLLSGPGTLVAPDGGRYEGAFLNGKFHGQGRYVWPSGARYEGQWANGQRWGQGSYTWENGLRYEGSFVANQRTGGGTSFFPSGDRLQGLFEDGAVNGQGKYFFANGNLYEGDFVKSKFSGRGVLTYANGNRYVGEFADDQRSGKGVLTWANGDRYEGDFNKGLIAGHGTLTWKDGGRYDGEFVEGAPHGRGTRLFPSGNKYEGNFVGGRFSGPGVYSWANGDRYEGGYVGGLQSGRGVLVSTGGWRYEGEFANGRQNGKGTMVWRDGSRYEGEFFNGAITGAGVQVSANRDRYQGEFLDNSFTGRGVLTRADGTVQEGEWLKGKLLGDRGTAKRGLAAGSLQNVQYSMQKGQRVFVAATFEDRPVHLVRDGLRGAGGWTAYVGLPAERVRLTIDDSKGLTGALAVEKGDRLTVNRVGQERIEYRLYNADRRFVTGAVLYRTGAGWAMGRLKTEAFWGYADLSDLEDLSPQFQAAGMTSPRTLTSLLTSWWNKVDLIPAAHADGLLDGYFSQSAQDARERWTAPTHEMFKASLVGAAAFTVKLLGQTVGAGETVAVAAAATPFLVAVGAGVVIGVAADNFYEWAKARNLSGSLSLGALFARYLAETGYSRLPDPQPPFGAASADKPPMPPAASTPVAGVDRSEFRKALERGASCAQGRDFACAEEALAAAQKLALTHQERRELIAKWQLLDGEKRQVELAGARKEPERSAQALPTPNAGAAGTAAGPARALTAVPANTVLAGASKKRAVGCLDALQGSWSHDVGGEWTFSGSTGTLVLHSTNQGGTARQTTVMEISSCEGGTLRYRLVRAAMESAYGSYDKTEDNDQPPTVNWSKVYSQPYSLSGDSLRLGNYNYER